MSFPYYYYYYSFPNYYFFSLLLLLVRDVPTHLFLDFLDYGPTKKSVVSFLLQTSFFASSGSQ